jgi:hypothetical protein
MPKKTPKNEKLAGAAPSTDSGAAVNSAACAVSECPSGIKIAIDAKPGAKQSSVVRIEDGAVTVQIAARAVEGAANSELVDFIAEVIGVRRQQLSLASGNHSRQKVLILAAPTALTVADILQKFADAVE